MSVVIVTGSCGLVGAEASRFYAKQGFRVVGIDNDMRAKFFGGESSTASVRAANHATDGYSHLMTDVRQFATVESVFRQYRKDIALVIHAAAQPSHDWAAREPLTDFDVNAVGTLNVLEATRRHAPEACFIFTSTNKVYGDTPNKIELVELDERYDVPVDSPYVRGIAEDMSIDASTHSVFGASKVAADVMVQEYGRYFGLKTGVFRCGCITGPLHRGAKLHGFLSYLVGCVARGETYTVIGHKGKQVRDNIHSYDLVRAFDAFFRSPRPGEVYNMGGGRWSSCSVLEALRIAQEVTGKAANYSVSDDARIGDHRWYMSDVSRFMGHYPGWFWTYKLRDIFEEIADVQRAAA